MPVRFWAWREAVPSRQAEVRRGVSGALSAEEAEEVSLITGVPGTLPANTQGLRTTGGCVPAEPPEPSHPPPQSSSAFSSFKSWPWL